MKSKIHTETLEALADDYNLEVFHSSDYGLTHQISVEGTHYASGYYWWPCSPGCLPDSDPIGPFKTYRDALLDATDRLGDK